MLQTIDKLAIKQSLLTTLQQFSNIVICFVSAKGWAK